MKRFGFIAMAFAMTFLTVVAVSAQTKTAFDASKFPGWVESDGL